MDSNIGVVRSLTLEPKLTSTRGYVDIHGRKHADELNSANLFTPAELLTPLGVQHDDPTRTSINLKAVEVVNLNSSNCWELLLSYHYYTISDNVIDRDNQQPRLSILYIR